MKIIDTHTHLYTEEFVKDRDVVMERALKSGVTAMLLPNIDLDSIDDMLSLSRQYPENCFPMMGLHPTSVNSSFQRVLEKVEEELSRKKYYGIGEIGIDLYWDKHFEEEQCEAFRYQLRLAKRYKLPVSIHTRESFDLALNIVKSELTDDLKGVFHCFTGNSEQAGRIMDTGFKLGIGGIVTFKNSGLAETVKKIPLESLVLETDAPWLTPVPYRGKRNESSYLTYIVNKIAEAKTLHPQQVAETTTLTASKLFNLSL